MRQVLLRLGLALAIAASVIVLAWSEIPIGGMAGAALDRTGPLVLIGGLVGVLIASLVGAVILRAGAAWVEQKDVKYSDAYVTMLLCGIATLMLRVVLRPAVGATFHVDMEVASRVAIVPTILLAFLIQAGLIGARHEIRFRRACLVCLVMLVLSAALALTIAGVAYLIRWGYRRLGVL
ncbi:MAG: hypothetical protein ACLQIB_40935 [Isosphaeraceae bacterium]